MFSLLLTGCSSGETPSLPDSNEASSSSPSQDSSATPTSSATKSPSESPSAEPTGAPDALEEGMVVPPAPKNDTGVDLPGVKPYTYSTIPAHAAPPVYENEAPQGEQGVPAEANTAFPIYAAFYDALSKEDWDKACEYVEIGEGKTKQFCVEWYGKNKAVTGAAPKLEDFYVRQEINSNSIILTSKDPEDVTQKQIRLNQAKGGWKVSISPITTDE